MFLVTGASGFVGSAVVRQLIAGDRAVRALVRPQSDRQNIQGLDVEIVEGDLMCPESLAAAVDGCRGVFHVAADYRLWTRHPEAMFQANVEGSRSVIMAAHQAGVERIVYTSSVATLGIVADGDGDERTPVTYADMIGPYKQSKFCAEEAVSALVNELSAQVVIVNPTTPIGPRDIKPTPTGRMIVEAGSGKMPAYVDTGLNVAHVDDVAAGHILAYNHGKIGERYVLGGENMALREILSVIAEIVGRKPPTVRIPHDLILPIAYLAESWAGLSGGGEPFVTIDAIKMAKKRMYFSSAKAICELGYSPRPASDALGDAVTWFRVNGYLR